MLPPIHSFGQPQEPSSTAGKQRKRALKQASILHKANHAEVQPSSGSLKGKIKKSRHAAPAPISEQEGPNTQALANLRRSSLRTSKGAEKSEASFNSMDEDSMGLDPIWTKPEISEGVQSSSSEEASTLEDVGEEELPSVKDSREKKVIEEMWQSEKVFVEMLNKSLDYLNALLNAPLNKGDKALLSEQIKVLEALVANSFLYHPDVEVLEYFSEKNDLFDQFKENLLQFRYQDLLKIVDCYASMQEIPQIANVLITPIQRSPRYLLFLTELEKLENKKSLGGDLEIIAQAKGSLQLLVSSLDQKTPSITLSVSRNQINAIREDSAGLDKIIKFLKDDTTQKYHLKAIKDKVRHFSAQSKKILKQKMEAERGKLKGQIQEAALEMGASGATGAEDGSRMENLGRRLEELEASLSALNRNKIFKESALDSLKKTLGF